MFNSQAYRSVLFALGKLCVSNYGNHIGLRMFETEMLSGYSEQIEVKQQEHRKEIHDSRRCRVLRDEQKEIRAFDILDLHSWKQITKFSSCLCNFTDF